MAGGRVVFRGREPLILCLNLGRFILLPNWSSAAVVGGAPVDVACVVVVLADVLLNAVAVVLLAPAVVRLGAVEGVKSSFSDSRNSVN